MTFWHGAWGRRLPPHVPDRLPEGKRDLFHFQLEPSRTSMRTNPAPKTRRVVNPSLVRELQGRLHRCENCGVERWRTPWPLDVHHVKTRGAGGGDTLDNLVLLCRLCHGEAQTYRIPRGTLLEITARRTSDPQWQEIARRCAAGEAPLERPRTGWPR